MPQPSYFANSQFGSRMLKISAVLLNLGVMVYPTGISTILFCEFFNPDGLRWMDVVFVVFNRSEYSILCDEIRPVARSVSFFQIKLGNYETDDRTDLENSNVQQLGFVYGGVGKIKAIHPPVAGTTDYSAQH